MVDLDSDSYSCCSDCIILHGEKTLVSRIPPNVNTSSLNSINNYSIDLSNCKYDHTLLFTQPYEKIQATWTIYDDTGGIIGEVFEDSFHELQSGSVYYFVSEDEFIVDGSDLKEETSGFEIIILLFSIFIVFIFMMKRK